MRTICTLAALLSSALGSAAPGGAASLIARALTSAPPPCAFFVAPAGSDSAPGTSAAPFATLPRAAAALRALQRPLLAPAIACVRAGVYARQPLLLGPADSGSSGANFVGFVSIDGPGKAVLWGGLDVPLAPLAAADAGWAHVPVAARSRVLVADLAAAGLTRADLGDFAVQDGFGSPCVGPPLEVLDAQGVAQTTARWPNAVQGAYGGPFATTQLTWTSGPDFFLAEPSAEFLGWTDTQDVWFHGYWWWQWNSVYAALDARAGWNATSGRVPLAPPYLGRASNASGAARYYALNSLSALDAPGEFVVNRTAATLYWLPPAGAPPAVATVTLTPTLVAGDGVCFFALAGFALAGSRGDAVAFEGASMRGLALLNLSIAHAGRAGINVYGATEVLVQGCSVSGTGGRGVVVASGPDAAARAALTPARLHVCDNTVHDFERFCFTYNPGMDVAGTAALIERNEVYNSGHFGMSLKGNDVMFRYNVMHHLVETTFDCAALYFEPNDWTLWNVTLQHNFAYLNGAAEVTPCNFRTSCLRASFYMDNGGAGLNVLGNVIWQPAPGAWNTSEFFRAPILVSVNNDGGRNTILRGNLVIDAPNGTYNSGGGIRWPEFGFMSNASAAYAAMRAVDWRGGAFAAAYPALAALDDFYAPDCARAASCPPAPFGNVVVRNVFVNLSGPVFMGPPATAFDPGNFNVTGNLVNVDPLFEAGSAAKARETLNFQLRSDSPAYAAGFERIPMECFGPWSGCGET